MFYSQALGTFCKLPMHANISLKEYAAMKAAFAIALIVFSVPCIAQSPGKADVFSSAQIRSQLDQLAQQTTVKGSSGSTLADYGALAIKLSERTVSGGAEIHAHFDDVMLVTEGKATLVTGGDLIDAHSVSEGEIAGTGIRNGVIQSVATGDVIHIPAGTPHQLLIAAGTTYSALVIKVKQ
jgi:mannose-6-phosphate isomerase-like protein (cupin superfamily)